MASASERFQEAECDAIVAAIQQAELQTSGEVRVYLEDTCTKDPAERAADLFHKLGVHKTALRNGVLIYLAVKDARFAILGDQGINEVVPPDFWDHIRATTSQHLLHERFLEALVSAIETVGIQLKHFFPRADDDINELPDEVIIGQP